MTVVRYDAPHATFPLLRPARPRVSTQARAGRRLRRPPVTPAQCRPYLDGNTCGLEMLYPYPFTTRVWLEDGALAVSFDPRPIPRFRSIVSSFAPEHVGLATECTLVTEPDVGVLILGPPAGQRPGPEPLRAYLETWWYPKPLFLVYRMPGDGAVLTWSPGDVLCTLLPLGRRVDRAEPLDADAAAALARRRERYASVESSPDMRWTSVEGYSFSHAYATEASRRGRRSAGGSPERGP